VRYQQNISTASHLSPNLYGAALTPLRKRVQPAARTSAVTFFQAAAARTTRGGKRPTLPTTERTMHRSLFWKNWLQLPCTLRAGSPNNIPLDIGAKSLNTILPPANDWQDVRNCCS